MPDEEQATNMTEDVIASSCFEDRFDAASYRPAAILQGLGVLTSKG